MLSADFLHLEKDVRMVNENADLFHLDIMDGTFVPNISYGFPVVEAIAKKAEKPLDAHLMIINPDKYVERFAAAGVKILTFRWKNSFRISVPADLCSLCQYLPDSEARNS